MKKRQQQGGRAKAAKLVGMSKDTVDRLSMGITFKCKYIGSLDVPKPCSRQEIISDMRRIRREFRTRKIKKAKVAVMVSTSGIKVALRSRRYKKSYSWTWDIQGLVILDNPIQRVFYVAHDSQDLKIFSYISRDPGTNTFKCNVFKSYKRADAERVVRMIGQAFGSRRLMNAKDEDTSSPGALEGSTETATTKDDPEAEADSLSSPAPPKPPRQLLDASVPLSVSHELQLLRQHLQLQEQHGQAALARAQLLKDQLRSETQARMEAQARVHQLLLHNRDLLDHINQLIQTLKELEVQVHSAGSADTAKPGDSNLLTSGRFSVGPAVQVGSAVPLQGDGADISRVPINANNLGNSSSKPPAERPPVVDEDAESFLRRDTAKFGQEAERLGRYIDQQMQGNKVAEQQDALVTIPATKEPGECMINSAFVEDDAQSAASSVLPAIWKQPATLPLAAVGIWPQTAPQRNEHQPYARLRPPSAVNTHNIHGLLNGVNSQHSGFTVVHNQDAANSATILQSSLSTPATGAKEPLGSSMMTDPPIESLRATGGKAAVDPAGSDQRTNGVISTADFSSESMTSRMQPNQGKDIAASQVLSEPSTPALLVPAKTRDETGFTRTTVLSGQNGSEDNLSKISMNSSRQSPSGALIREGLTSPSQDAPRNTSAAAFWSQETGARTSATSQRHATVLPYAWSRISAPERISRTKSLLRRHRDDWQSHLELIREHSSVSSESNGAPVTRSFGGDWTEKADAPQSTDGRPLRWSAIEADQPSAENFSLLTGNKTSTIDSLMAINFLRKNL